jgi:hypothetical protein
MGYVARKRTNVSDDDFGALTGTFVGIHKNVDKNPCPEQDSNTPSRYTAVLK